MGDPYFDSVGLLIHGDTAITDVKGQALGLGGGVAVSAAKSVFGGGAIRLNGTNQYVDSGTNSNLAFASGIFSVEFWVCSDEPVGGYRFVYSRYRPWYYYDISIVQTPSGSLALWTYGNKKRAESAPLVAGQWYFVRLINDGSTTTLAIDGSIVGGMGGWGYSSLTNHHHFGRRPDYSTEYFAGYIDDIRITKGVIRSGAIPTAPFPDSYGGPITSKGSVIAESSVAGIARAVRICTGKISSITGVKANASALSVGKGNILSQTVLFGKTMEPRDTRGVIAAGAAVTGHSASICQRAGSISSAAEASGKGVGITSSRGEIGAFSNLNGSAGGVLRAVGQVAAGAALDGGARAIKWSTGQITSFAWAAGQSGVLHAQPKPQAGWGDSIITHIKEDKKWIWID